MKRTVTSPMGLYLVPLVQRFLVDNAKLNENGATAEVGSDDIANAIEYATNLALSSPIMQTAFSAGISPPGGGAVGALIYAVIETQCTEK